MVLYFTLIAVFIACLGLYSLAALMAESRIKEIGVRKILGASVSSISLLLSKDLLKFVVIGFAIAIPAGYYAMELWLNDFVYRVTIVPGFFLAAGAMTILTAWITVSYKVIRSSLSNPVDTLRYE